MRWRVVWAFVLLAGLASPLELGPARQKRQAFTSCEAAVQSCATHFADTTSYPNIAAGERHA